MNLTKSDVKMLKRLSKGTHLIEDHERDQLNSLKKQGLVKFSYIQKNDIPGAVVITSNRASITFEGRHALEEHREARRRWFGEHWLAPFFTGFISGALIATVTSLLLK